MCGSRGKYLVINSSYYNWITFTLNPLPCNTTYPSWLTTFYGCPSFIMLLWSYHWQFKYSFVSMLLQELEYNSPWYTLTYCHSYCFGKWSTCLKGGLPPFLSSQSITNGYPYHKNNFWILMNVIIVDLTRTNMVQQTLIMTKHVMKLVAQNKTQSHIKQALGDDFIPCAIEMYGHFHFHFDYFFIACAHTIILCH